jgi:uncharacterized protein YjbI with pentapeptide repeats
MTWTRREPETDHVVAELDDEVELARLRVAGARLTGRDWEGEQLTDVVFEDCELSGVTLTSASLVRVQFTRCRMSGLVAPEVKAKDVAFVDCTMPDAWLRMAVMEQCELAGCDLTGADLYEAKLTKCNLLRCNLTEVELSKLSCDEVTLHGSNLDGIRGAGGLRGLIIASDQILSIALPILADRKITVDDTYFDDPA